MFSSCDIYLIQNFLQMKIEKQVCMIVMKIEKQVCTIVMKIEKQVCTIAMKVEKQVCGPKMPLPSGRSDKGGECSACVEVKETALTN